MGLQRGCAWSRLCQSDPTGGLESVILPEWGRAPGAPGAGGQRSSRAPSADSFSSLHPVGERPSRLFFSLQGWSQRITSKCSHFVLLDVHKHEYKCLCLAPKDKHPAGHGHALISVSLRPAQPICFTAPDATWQQ